MNHTTNEQSKKLVALGLDPNTADMHYRKWNNKWCPELLSYKKRMEPDDDGGTIGTRFVRPCWSLGVLLDLLPQSVCTDDGDEYVLSFGKEDDLSYNIIYNDEYENVTVHESFCDDLIDCAFETLCWLLENNHI
jgi:hypothetical protein